MHRIRIGFDISAKDQDAKVRMPGAADTLVWLDAKFEMLPDLIAMRIATVHVTLHTLFGEIEVTLEMIQRKYENWPGILSAWLGLKEIQKQFRPAGHDSYFFPTDQSHDSPWVV